MAGTRGEWLEEQSERILARQRSRVETAKLVATFAAAIAGGLVASALQGSSGKPSTWDWVAAWALAGTVLLTAAVMLADRLREPDHYRVLELAALAHPPWDDDRVLAELRQAALAATDQNEGVISRVQAVLCLQLLATVFTGVAAAYAMLRSTR